MKTISLTILTIMTLTSVENAQNEFGMRAVNNTTSGEIGWLV